MVFVTCNAIHVRVHERILEFQENSTAPLLLRGVLWITANNKKKLVLLLSLLEDSVEYFFCYLVLIK